MKAATLHPGPCSLQVTKRTEGRRSSQAANPDVLVDRSRRGTRLQGRRSRRKRREKQRGCSWPWWV
ncbi:unnamed protein product [Lactuca virosa]|uniref:Uncharacterized protein n=1 Tax=Lactuca virosa TaxID=75947 RepID=A0AAU9NN39_9ASTR|nr:unnamed protein product [Lactuca virosa]